MDTITLLDAQHRAKMEEASRIFVRALRGHPGPSGLRWREAYLPENWKHNPHSQNTMEMNYRATLHAEKRERAEQQRVDARDPCFHCGVRQDLGCGCRRGW